MNEDGRKKKKKNYFQDDQEASGRSSGILKIIKS